MPCQMLTGNMWSLSIGMIGSRWNSQLTGLPKDKYAYYFRVMHAAPSFFKACLRASSSQLFLFVLYPTHSIIVICWMHMYRTHACDAPNRAPRQASATIMRYLFNLGFRYWQFFVFIVKKYFKAYFFWVFKVFLLLILS